MSRLVGAALLVLLAGAAAVARAQDREPAPIPKAGSFEIRFGTYRPNIDSEFAGTTSRPYSTIFGTDRGWMFRAGGGKSLFTAFGTLEAGITAGYFEAVGKGLLPNADGTVSTNQSGDSTSFKVIPTSLGLTYRFDWLPEHTWVPLAPYGRVSLERYYWWVTNGAGHTVKDGATNGWSATGGAALMLDFFDPGLARELERETGIHHTYLFFDVTKSWVKDFGSSKSWDLSDQKLSLNGGLWLVF
jgi:hypothetical protein